MVSESPPPSDDRTQYQRARDRAYEHARAIITHGVEECHPSIALDVRLYDKRFAQYVDMMEHIKAEFYSYVRDKYGMQ